MRRWTDGKSWSASRVSGSFLTYREMEGKRGGGFSNAKRGSKSENGRDSDENHDDGEPEGYRYKADGLMKQSFSITTSTGQHLHLIAYYSRPVSGQPELKQPTTDPNLRNFTPVKGMYPETSIGDSHLTPALTRVPMHHTPAYAAQQHYPPQPYPPQYGQPAYGWPHGAHQYNSPMYQPGVPMPAHVVSHAQPPQPSFPAPHYEHGTLLPPPQRRTYPSPPRQHDSPSQNVSSGDSRLNSLGHGPLPALNAVTAGAPGTSIAAEAPPSRGNSISPPQSSHSDAAPRTKLPQLLNSQTLPAPSEPTVRGEDSRALQMLNRSAFRQMVS